MKDDKLKELEGFLGNVRNDPRDFFWTTERVDKILGLITAYRQLEKDLADRKETRKITEALRVQLMKDGVWNYQEGDPHYYDLIDAKAELLAALKEIEFQAKGVTLSNDSKYQSEVAQCIENNARQAHNKHKVE